MESDKGFFVAQMDLLTFQVAKIYGTMDDLRLENERVQDGRWGVVGR